MEQAAALQLDYQFDGEFNAEGAVAPDHLLGVIEFGAARALASAPHCPHARVPMPVLGATQFAEVWSSSAPVRRFRDADIDCACSGNALFGVLQIEQSGGLADTTRAAYERIIDCVDRQGFPHLLRLWNYFPQINAPESGLERYRCFSAGRHDAFVAKGRTIGPGTPAACALGTASGPIVIYFLAATHAGTAVENPRQVSAYDYPIQYGPRSPSFSRATRVGGGPQPMLLISGTASIVGHETVHPGDARQQLEETLTNLRAVSADTAHGDGGRLYLKAYLRDAAYLPFVQTRLRAEFGPQAHIAYLQADICRSDLLLEIDGLWLDAAQ
jgi:chorismate lyase/3-hydroxybenzoate synthase